MDISDIDIYDDLDEFHEKEEKKSAELLSLEAKYKESLETIELMKVEINTLRKKQRIIEVNFQNLLDTAKTEIKRKNDQIAQLQREKDDICFRRKHANTVVAAGATHKQFNDGVRHDDVDEPSSYKGNPFKQNLTKATAPLVPDTALPANQLPVVQDTTLPAKQQPAVELAKKNNKRELTPISSDESWDDADNVGHTHKTQQRKKLRYDEEHKKRRRVDIDAERTHTNKRERSRSRDRNYRSSNDARSNSRYKYNKSQRSSDTEDPYSDLQRDRRHERESGNERHRRRSREGRPREGRNSEHERKYRKASRCEPGNVEKEDYFKQRAQENESSSRSSSRKKRFPARENDKESNKKQFHKNYDRHEYDHEKRLGRSKSREINKKELLLDEKDKKSSFSEMKKVLVNQSQESQATHKEHKPDNKKSKENTAKHCKSQDNGSETAESNQNRKESKNDNDGKVVLDDRDVNISVDNISNSSSDTIIFENVKDTNIKNSSKKRNNDDLTTEKSDDTLNTPKKVALFNALFGSPGGVDTKTNKNSKLLNNVLEILKSDTAKSALSADDPIRKVNEDSTPNPSKKQNDNKNIVALEKDAEKSSKIITKTSTSNKEATKENSKNIKQKPETTAQNSKAEKLIKTNEVIEIDDDTDIDTTSDEIEFFNVEKFLPKHSDNTKSCAANLESSTSENISKHADKVDKIKKPLIEIIEDIRLPAMLPLKQMLKIHRETCTQKQQERQIQSEQICTDLSSNSTVFNTDDELDISDQTEVIFDETNCSMFNNDDQLTDFEDFKESKPDSQANHNLKPTNSEKCALSKADNLEIKDIATAQQEQSMQQTEIISISSGLSVNEVIPTKLIDVATAQVEAQKDAVSIVDLDIDEVYAVNEQEQDKPEMLEQTQKLNEKQENSLEINEKTNEANMRMPDLQIEPEDKQENSIESTIPIANKSENEKAKFSQTDIIEKNVADVKLQAIASDEHKSTEETDENVPIASYAEQRAECTDENIIEKNKTVMNDNLVRQNVDDSTAATSAKVVADDNSTDNDKDLTTENVTTNKIENSSNSIASQKLDELHAIILNESDDFGKTIDKVQKIVESDEIKQKRKEDKNDNENYIETASHKNEGATIDANNLDVENLNDDVSDTKEGDKNELAEISKDASITPEKMEDHGEIKCASDEGVSTKCNTKEKEELQPGETHMDPVKDTEMDAEVKDIEMDAEVKEAATGVNPKDIEADMKEPQVVLKMNENTNKQIKETKKPEDLEIHGKKDDINSKEALQDNAKLLESNNITPINDKITLNEDLNIDFKERFQIEAKEPKHNAKHNLKEKQKAKKAYEIFKESVKTDDKIVASKIISKAAAEEHINEISIGANLNASSNTKIITNIVAPKVKVVLSANDKLTVDEHLNKQLTQEDIVSITKEQIESKTEEFKTQPQLEQKNSLHTSDVKQSVNGMDNKESTSKSSFGKIAKYTSNEGKQNKIKSNEQEIKTGEAHKPNKTIAKPSKHTYKTHELDQTSKVKRLAFNPLHELSAIVGEDETYYTNSEDDEILSPKALKHSDKKSSTKNFFKIIVAPKVEARKRKLPAGYKIPKIKQPKLDTTDDPNDKTITKATTKIATEPCKDHKENVSNKDEVEQKEEKILSTAKNSTKVKSNKTVSCSMKTASSVSSHGEEKVKINIPTNNRTSPVFEQQKKNSACLEPTAPEETHKLALSDPRNPVYSDINANKVDKIKQKVNDKLLEVQAVISGHSSASHVKQIPAANVKTHSDLKQTTNNVRSKITPNTQIPASSSTTPNRTKSKLFRRILDSSSENEGSDEQNVKSAESRMSSDNLRSTTPKLITPNREPQRKKKKRRVVLVTTINDVSNTAEHEIPAPSAAICAPSTPVRAPSTPVLAPPTPDHAIFHNEPETGCLNADSTLLQFSHLQDKQFTDIDSRLQSMFQSPPYLADQQTQISKNLFSPQQQNATTSPPMTHTTSLNDSSVQAANNSETKRLSLGTSQYLVEKVSENVVNVFITRKRPKKKNTPNNPKPEVLTSVSGAGVA